MITLVHFQFLEGKYPLTGKHCIICVNTKYKVFYLQLMKVTFLLQMYSTKNHLLIVNL
jgi:hypothetical protein